MVRRAKTVVRRRERSAPSSFFFCGWFFTSRIRHSVTTAFRVEGFGLEGLFVAYWPVYVVPCHSYKPERCSSFIDASRFQRWGEGEYPRNPPAERAYTQGLNLTYDRSNLHWSIAISSGDLHGRWLSSELKMTPNNSGIT